MPNSYYTADQVSDDYWVIRDVRSREVGAVRGGGPTVATRFKAITMRHADVDPDAADGAHLCTLHEAAMWLAAPDAPDEATRETVRRDGRRVAWSVVQTFGGDWRCSRGDEVFRDAAAAKAWLVAEWDAREVRAAESLRRRREAAAAAGQDWRAIDA